MTVRLGQGNDVGARLLVQDDGPGVPTASLPKLTARFYRTDCSRSTPGNGLGLSLAKVITDLHEAAMRIEDVAPNLRIAIDFPNVASIQFAQVPSVPTIA